MFVCVYVYVNSKSATHHTRADKGLLPCVVPCLEKARDGTEEDTNMDWLLWQKYHYSKIRVQSKSEFFWSIERQSTGKKK